MILAEILNALNALAMVPRWIRGRCLRCGGPKVRDTFEVGGYQGATTIVYCPKCDKPR